MQLTGFHYINQGLIDIPTYVFNVGTETGFHCIDKAPFDIPTYLFNVGTETGFHYINQEEFKLTEATPIIAKKGDVVIFSYLIVHGSYLNTWVHIFIQSKPKYAKCTIVQTRKLLIL